VVSPAPVSGCGQKECCSDDSLNLYQKISLLVKLFTWKVISHLCFEENGSCCADDFNHLFGKTIGSCISRVVTAWRRI